MTEADLQAIQSHAGSPIKDGREILEAVAAVMRQHQAAVDYRDIHIHELVAEVRRLRALLNPPPNKDTPLQDAAQRQED